MRTSERKAGIPAFVVAAGCCAMAMVTGISCEMMEKRDDGSGELHIAFDDADDGLTRAGVEIPDTSDFMLKVCDASGNVIYNGAYGDSPESMMVSAGSYAVSVMSGEFLKPAFSAPQYGDEQCVVVPDGGVADVKLVCRQINSGVVLKVDPGFLTQYPDGVLFLKSSQGRLMYGYSEKRIAYFSPGSVSLILTDGGQDKTLMTRTLRSQEVLAIHLGTADSGSTSSSTTSGVTAGRISVSIDTTRVWTSETYILGDENSKGGSTSDAFTVSQAVAAGEKDDVWVSGYIVGGDMTSSSASFEEPFSSRTCILLGPRSSTEDRDVCIAVQLPSGSIRDVLNLVENPSMLGRKVCLKGDLVEAYYGLPGLKNVSEYELQ